MSDLRLPTSLREQLREAEGVPGAAEKPMNLFKRKKNRYRLTVDRAYAEAIEMGLYYVMSAAVLGDIAEFGTHGTTAVVTAEFLSKHPKFKRNMALFDSFQGFPPPMAAPDIECPHVVSGAWAKGTSRGVSMVVDVHRMVLKWIPAERFRIYDGWYEDTLPQIPKNTTFSLLIMDCCFYLSHYQVLNYLFSNRMLAEGCMILFSDWNANRASWQYGSRKAWGEMTQRHAVNYEYAGNYAWGSQKFIVHGYRGDQWNHRKG